MKRLIRKSTPLLAMIVIVFLAGCNSGTNTLQNDQFSISAIAPTDSVLEGDANTIAIPISITRLNDNPAALTLSVSTEEQFLNTSLTDTELATDNDTTVLNVSLAIADLPIQAHSKFVDVTATDGTNVAVVRVSIPVQPTSAPDIYLLAGQSNMIGFSGDGTKQAFAGGPDEPHPRIKQLNVSSNNNPDLIFTTEADFTSPSANTVEPIIVQAEDPLHVPLDPLDPTGKDHNYIGLGLSFAKAALPNTTADIILVPAAWSGSAFCDNDFGPIGQWNALPTDDTSLGNTWMFDRAVTRANMAITETGGVLRGILWHQGESDDNALCSVSYAENLERLAKRFRLDIITDARGGDLRTTNANIPFIVGSMSKGVDERDDLSDFGPDKLIIDATHRNISLSVEHAGFSNHDDLVPSNGYACGNTSCIHFGPQALREMGSRYYQALLNAANN